MGAAGPAGGHGSQKARGPVAEAPGAEPGASKAPIVLVGQRADEKRAINKMIALT